jgi:hypothetical protein
MRPPLQEQVTGVPSLKAVSLLATQGSALLAVDGGYAFAREFRENPAGGD